MFEPKICPVCKGEGTVVKRNGMEAACHGCEGYGWVTPLGHYSIKHGPDPKHDFFGPINKLNVN